MFEQSMVDQGKTNRTSTVLLSFVAQCIGIVLLVLLPMIYFDTLPATRLTSFLVAPPPPPPPPPPPAEAPKVVKVIPRQFDAGRLVAPKDIPDEIAIIEEEELPPMTGAVGVAGIAGGIPGGGGGVIGGILGGVPTAAPPPPPPKPKPKPVQRIRVGGAVQKARLIRQPTPVYPPLARQARIQGTVRFNAIIGKDGNIENLTLVSGHPMLVPAAQAAVVQWQYQPTLLNGEPVEVVTVIDVNFTLSG